LRAIFETMNWAVIILLILFGLIALVLEILIVPGGVVGVLGLLSITGGIVISYISYGSVAGNITLIATVLITIAGLILSIRGRTWRKLMLKTEIDAKMNVFDEQKITVGAEGRTLSRLAPSGKAVFDGETVEATSLQNLINENTKVVIVKIDGPKIFVKEME